MKTWLITGCSSGIGKGIAKAVFRKWGSSNCYGKNKDKVMDIVESFIQKTALAVSFRCM